MTTLNSLKPLLLGAIPTASKTRPLSEAEYRAGSQILSQGSTTHENFIIPQLSSLLTPFFHSRSDVSVLEIGPGPKSVLGDLPNHLRRKIRRYAAFEPNGWYAYELDCWCETDDAFPGLEGSADVQCAPFDLDVKQKGEGFDQVLFGHSMYGMDPKREYMTRSESTLNRRWKC